MIKKNEVNAPLEQKPLKEETQSHDNLVNQLLYLQKTIGNKEVGDLIGKNVIFSASTPNDQNNLVRSERKKREYEQNLILEDRKEIEEEALRKIHEEKEDAVQALVDRKPGKEVFANVRAEMMYVEIPGDMPAMFYHHTKLVDISLSNQEIERKGESRKIKRGMVVPVTYSFKVELKDTVPRTSQKEEHAEEKVAEQESSKTEAPPVKEELPPDSMKAETKPKK